MLGFHSVTRLAPIVGQITKHLSSTVQHQHNRKQPRPAAESDTLPTTLQAAVRILPEVRSLSNSEHQEFEIAIEIEAVLHNRKLLRDSSIDVVFVIDNASVDADIYRAMLCSANTSLQILHKQELSGQGARCC
jgi:hypothetical protein